MHLGGIERKRGKRRLWLAAIVSLVLVAPATTKAASVDAIDVALDSIVLRFDAAVPRASAFVIDDPRRIAVDLKGARAGHAAARGGLISATRHGQYDSATARVVFDLAEPAIVTGGRFADDGRSLTLSIKSVSKALFTTESRAARKTFLSPLEIAARPPGERSRIRIPLDPPRSTRATALPPVSGARGTNRPLVVIDPGHGGHDPGSSSANGRKHEKDASLAIAKAIRDELVQSGRVRVALTRSDDRFLVLGERREIARRLNADLFISVHADSAPNHDARGATIYTLSEVASDRVAAQLAARENRADILNGVDLGGENAQVSSILFDLAQRETMNVSASFATLLQREMSPAVPFKDEYHRFAGLVVLKAPDVPSVLLETGYISNEDDAKLLFSKPYQKDIAVGVRKAVETHFARRLAER